MDQNGLSAIINILVMFLILSSLLICLQVVLRVLLLKWGSIKRENGRLISFSILLMKI